MVEMQISEARLPLFHAAFAIDIQWLPISAYDKRSAPPALLRGQGQMVLGQWRRAGEDGRLGDRSGPAWCSMEDSTLDDSLWFEPDEFAALEDNDEPFFV